MGDVKSHEDFLHLVLEIRYVNNSTCLMNNTTKFRLFILRTSSLSPFRKGV